MKKSKKMAFAQIALLAESIGMQCKHDDPSIHSCRSLAKEIILQCNILERGLENDEQGAEKSGDEGAR